MQAQAPSRTSSRRSSRRCSHRARSTRSSRHRSFWLDGDFGGGVSWQRFIARLVAHGPVSEFVPGSILQATRSDYTILGAVADDVEIHMA